LPRQAAFRSHRMRAWDPSTVTDQRRQTT
jgi:hypothetical protein